MSRLSIMERDALGIDERRFYDAVRAIRRRPISGPFIVLLNGAPDLAARFAHLGHYFHARGQADESALPMRVRTFMAMIGSRALDAPYEWSAWVGWALEAGVPQATIDAIREHAPLTALSAEDVLVRDFCAALALGDHHVNDALFARALEHFGVPGVTDLVAALGYFAMIAFPLNAFEMEMSSEQKRDRKPFAPLRFAAHSAAWKQAPVDSSWPGHGAGRRAPRLPEISAHAHLPREHQHFLDRIVRLRGSLAAPYDMLMNSPDVAERIAYVGAYFLHETQLAPLPRALTWLFTAREFDCPRAWSTGLVYARKAGLERAKVEALEARRAEAFAGDERLLLDFCAQLTRGNHHVDDASYRAALDRYGVRTLVEVSATLGYVAMMAIIANAFELDDGGAQSDELVL